MVVARVDRSGSRGNRNLSDPVQRMSRQGSSAGIRVGKHTVNHLINSFLVVFAQVNNTCARLLELMRTCAVEEPASRAHNGSVYGPLLGIASNCKIRETSADMQPALSVSTAHGEKVDWGINTHAARALISSF